MDQTLFFFVQAEDGIRDAQESRGLGDVYKRQEIGIVVKDANHTIPDPSQMDPLKLGLPSKPIKDCLLYTSDAADDLLCVDLGGRRIIKQQTINRSNTSVPTLRRS